MYPNINITFNIAPNTLVGKINIQGDFDFVKDEDEDYDMGKDFVENMLIKNPCNMGSKWFGLPTFEVLYDEFKSSLNL